MIRLGKLEDVAILDSFDPFGGSREVEISGGHLHVFENEHGRPIGYVSVADYTFHGFPYITFLSVHPDNLRKGIASELLHRVEESFRGQRIFISTEADNQPMLALLEKRKYRLSGALGGLNDSHSGVDEVFFYKDM